MIQIIITDQLFINLIVVSIAVNEPRKYLTHCYLTEQDMREMGSYLQDQEREKETKDNKDVMPNSSREHPNHTSI